MASRSPISSPTAGQGGDTDPRRRQGARATRRDRHRADGVGTRLEVRVQGQGGAPRTHNVVTFEGVAGGTQVTWTDEVELLGIFGLLEPLMGRMVRRGYEAELGRLKAILEAQPAEGT